MTSGRIAGVPAELSSLSRALSEVAPDLHRTATRLGGISLPELPPAVAGVVSDTLGSVGQRLRSAALTVERERLDLDKRVYWLAIAGEGGRLMDVYPRLPRLPWENERLPGFPPEPELPDFGPLPVPGGGVLPGFTIPGLPGLPNVVHSGDGEGGRESDDEGDTGGGERPEGYPEPDEIATDPEDRDHILDGDERGGGHRPGTGTPGKSEFPPDWSDDKIVVEIEDVARDPDAIEHPRYPGDYWVATGERDGVEIRVVVRPDGSVRTGYPTNLPRNPAA